MSEENRWKEFVEDWFYNGISNPWSVIRPKDGHDKSEIKAVAVTLHCWGIEHNTKMKKVANMMSETFEFIENEDEKV